jgi:alkylation response protein AidB-like acyl-CoA dehydrogenase
MEFGLSQEQILLQDSVNRYLSDNASLDRVRGFADDKNDRGDDIWKGLTELGLPALLIPEAQGGVDLTLLDAAIVSEVLGMHATPAPFIPSAVLAVMAVRLAGDEETKARYLPRIADGSLRVGAALSEVPGARHDAGVSVNSDGTLSGKSLFVLDANADSFLVADTQRRLYIVNSDSDGVEKHSLPQIDRTRPIAELRFNHAPADFLIGSSDGEACLEVIDIGRVMLAADTLGAAQKMLDQAVSYAMEREQFNRIIASFQAVKHMCAEMTAEIEPSRALVWYAAHALEAVPDEARLTSCHAKAHLGEVGKFVAKTATIVHGGMGFTDLAGLHYWFKRIGFNRQILGGPELVRKEAARVQGFISAKEGVRNEPVA